MPVIMAGMDHRTVMWRLTGAVLGQGLLHARWCAMSGVMVQTVQKTVWRFHRCCSSSRSSTLHFAAQWQFPMVQTIQQIIEIPLSFVFGGRCPCLQVHFSSWCRGRFHGPDCPSDLLLPQCTRWPMSLLSRSCSPYLLLSTTDARGSDSTEYY